jgi:hypothetical protein
MPAENGIWHILIITDTINQDTDMGIFKFKDADEFEQKGLCQCAFVLLSLGLNQGPVSATRGL